MLNLSKLNLFTYSRNAGNEKNPLEIFTTKNRSLPFQTKGKGRILLQLISGAFG